MAVLAAATSAAAVGGYFPPPVDELSSSTRTAIAGHLVLPLPQGVKAIQSPS